MSAHDFDWFVANLSPVTWGSQTRGKRDYFATCPVHDGVSLHVTEGARGKPLLNCFGAGCTFAAIVAELEATSGDTEDTQAGEPEPRRREPRPAYSPAGDLVAHQVYRSGRWVWSPALRPLGVSPSDLHGGLGTMAGVPLDLPIVLTEGHGPAIALNEHGIPAVAVVTGKSSAISPVGASVLYGRKVILSPDVDGAAHMDRNGDVLTKIAAQVLVAPPWPSDFEANWDAAQYLERFGVEAMREHYANATPWVPSSTLAVSLATFDRIDPEPLVDEFAHPTAHTGLWGPNGAGKGVFAAWKVAARTRAGERVLILDYEGHVGEWRARIEDFKGDLSLVFIALPMGLPNGMLKGAIWEQEDQIRAAADAVGADWVYVDSATAACGVADISDSTAPGPYFAALTHIGRPSVTIGHVTKTEALAYPFGSMAWRAFIRMGWSFARGEGETRDLVNRKTNDYPEQASVTYAWGWTHELPPQRVPETLTPMGTPTRKLWERAYDALGDAEMSANDLLAAINEDGFEPTKLKTLQNTLSASEMFEQPPGRRGVWRRTSGVTVSFVPGRSREEALPDEPSEIGKKSGRSREEAVQPRSHSREEASREASSRVARTVGRESREEVQDRGEA